MIPILELTFSKTQTFKNLLITQFQLILLTVVNLVGDDFLTSPVETADFVDGTVTKTKKREDLII